MKIGSMLDDEEKSLIRDTRKSAPQFVPHKVPIGRAYMDVKTGDILYCEAHESRSEKFRGRRLRFLGDAVIHPLGWDGDPGRIGMLYDMSRLKLLPPEQQVE